MVTDKAKLRQYNRNWYEKNKYKRRAAVQARRDSLREWLKARKRLLRCERCGEDSPVCLEFHHDDPSEKEISISKAPNLGWSIARMEAEIEKCSVLCSNCHKKEHATELGW